jgi:hypothetical protein
MEMTNNIKIAQVCHNLNMAICQSFGDNSQQSWDDAEQWQRDSAIAGVEFAQQNPDAGPGAQHESWRADKEAAGWIYGNVKNSALRIHPCMVPFNQLPPDQRLKDAVFIAVVKTLSE